MKAFSPETGKSYASFDELVAAEANGYVVVITSDRPNTGALVVGPFADKAEANTKRARIVYRARRDEAPHKVHSSVRILWKEKR